MMWQPDLFEDHDPETVVKEVLAKNYSLDGEGMAYEEIYPDQGDFFEDTSLQRICGEPGKIQEYFWEWLDEVYWEASQAYEQAAFDLVRKDERLKGVSDEDLWSLIHLFFYVTFPEDYWLKQQVPVDIIVDTGDANYDFACNKLDDDANFPAESSLVWLAKQQGCTKTQLKQAATKTSDSKLLNSLIQESAELPSGLGALTFLVRMPLSQLIELDNAMEMEKELDSSYLLKERKGRGYIVLDKKVSAGLYNSWSGAGGMFEIELEQDVRLPIRCIHRAIYDGKVSRWSVKETYGCGDEFWTEDALKQIVNHREAFNTRSKK